MNSQTNTLSDSLLLLPAPPRTIGQIAYRLKVGMRGLHIPIAKAGDVVDVGSPLVAWGSGSTALKDTFFIELQEKLMGRDPSSSVLLSPVAGVVEWVNPGPEVGIDWDTLSADLAPQEQSYSSQNAVAIRPFETHSRGINWVPAYSELCAFAKRHAKKRNELDTVNAEIRKIESTPPLVIQTGR